MKKGLIICFVIASVLLTSCSKTQTGWVATNIGENFQASYQRFDGREVETFQLDSGETFSLTFDIVVDEGSLTLTMIDPEDNQVWEETFSEDAQNSFEFTPETDGRYRLHIIGDETQGSFDLNWNITE